MFGFGRRYYVVEERNNDGCLSGCLLWLIIIAILVAMFLLFAWYALIALVILLLVVGAVIGIFYSVKNNVKAYSDSYISNRYYSRPNTSKFLNFVFKTMLICKKHMIYTWKSNAASIKDLFAKSEKHRFLSFQKWMYLFACLSVAVWGVIISLFIVNIYMQVLMAALMIAFYACVIAFIIPIIIAIPLAIWNFVKNYIYILKYVLSSYQQIPGSSVYIYNKGYRHVVSVFKNTFRKNLFDAKDKLRVGSTFAIFSLRRWISYCTAIWLMVLGTVLQIPLLLIHALTLTIMIALYTVAIGFFFALDAIFDLLVNKSVSCPNIACNNRFKRNVYVCDCGKQFNTLHPSTQGIFKRKCDCGRMIPNSIFSGKHKMKDLCPKCGVQITR